MTSLCQRRELSNEWVVNGDSTRIMPQKQVSAGDHLNGLWENENGTKRTLRPWPSPLQLLFVSMRDKTLEESRFQSTEELKKSIGKLSQKGYWRNIFKRFSRIGNDTWRSVQMWEAVSLKETKFCELVELNSASPDVFSLLIEHTSYI